MQLIAPPLTELECTKFVDKMLESTGDQVFQLILGLMNRQLHESRDFVMLSEDLHNQTLSVKKCHKIYFSVATNNARIEIEKNLLNKRCH